jgi:hypothetical protein
MRGETIEEMNEPTEATSAKKNEMLWNEWMKAGKQSITADNVQISSDMKQGWQLTLRAAANFVPFPFLSRTTESCMK